MRAVDGVELLFHLVAAMKGSPADMFQNSVLTARNLLEAIGDRKPIRIVLVSSFGVYGVAGLGRGAMVDESAPLEPNPGKRDLYSHTKLRQEQLFHEYEEKLGFELVCDPARHNLRTWRRPLSGRVGLNLFGCFLHLGGSNLLPLTYVENCAEAIVVAETCRRTSAGKAYNVHDDDLPTSRQYLRLYKRHVRNVRSVRVPYFGLLILSHMMERYHRWSKGQCRPSSRPIKPPACGGGIVSATRA